MHNRAKVLVALGRHTEAITAFDQLIGLDPYYADYRADRASLLASLGEPDKALADYNWAIATQPPFSPLFANRGALHAELGNHPAAVSDYRTAIDLEPSIEDGWVGLADQLLAVADLNRAEQAAREGLIWNPDSSGLRCLLADVLEAQGRESESTAVLDDVLDADPRCVPALARRAGKHYVAGRWTDAIGDLDRAVDITDTADLRLNRGLVHEAIGNLELALADLSAAALLPDAEPAGD